MDRLPRDAKRIAFFGGSFDPPHQAHLAVAQAARLALSLDTVLFAPVGAQPLKPQGSTASFEDRLEMTRLAIAGDPGFAASRIDAPHPDATPNYTIDTLVRLRAELPPEGNLYCLMGADSFFGLRRWRRSSEIPFVAPLIVASRPGQPLDDLRAALPHGLTMEPAPDSPVSGGEQRDSSVELRCYLLHDPAGRTAPLYLLPGLHIDVSASQVREQIQAAANASCPGPQLLSRPVLDYIRAHGLYW
jgi:nicotinate-nucleotide adenylyltransferase